MSFGTELDVVQEGVPEAVYTKSGDVRGTIGDKLCAIAVGLGSRVAALRHPDEVGIHGLRGVPGARRLCVVEQA